jgi:hypothetical protein
VGNEADHQPAFSAKVKNEWSFTTNVLQVIVPCRGTNLPLLTGTSKIHFYNSHVSLLLSLYVLMHIERKKNYEPFTNSHVRTAIL